MRAGKNHLSTQQFDRGTQREAPVDLHRKLVDEQKSSASRSIEVSRRRVSHYSIQSDGDVDFN